MKYTKEIKKGFLITGTIVVFALVAIVFLFLVANLDYDFINSAWSDLMHIFKIKNEEDLQAQPQQQPQLNNIDGQNSINTNQTDLKPQQYDMNQFNEILEKRSEYVKHKMETNETFRSEVIKFTQEFCRKVSDTLIDEKFRQDCLQVGVIR